MIDLGGIDWSGGGWITYAIHGYAAVVFVLTLLVYVVHNARLRSLGRRIATISNQIEGDTTRSRTRQIDLDQITPLILQLGDLVERRNDLDISPVLDFIRQEERQRSVGVVETLVDLTQTMIELFPMLGIFGTVWAIAGVSAADLGSDSLLTLFGTAIQTTLWAMLYVIVFRIVYSAFVYSKVVTLATHNSRFQEFLGILEKRTGILDYTVSGPANPWKRP